MHSYPDCPAKHTLAECSENPANQKKPAKQVEAYYAHDACCLANDAKSYSNHLTAPASDSKESSRRLEYSNNKDNFAVAISTLPCKQAKRGAQPPKRELTIAMSNTDNNEDDTASTKLAKLAESFVAPSMVG
jgi:hypothetical protein